MALLTPTVQTYCDNKLDCLYVSLHYAHRLSSLENFTFGIFLFRTSDSTYLLPYLYQTISYIIHTHQTILIILKCGVLMLNKRINDLLNYFLRSSAICSVSLVPSNLLYLIISVVQNYRSNAKYLCTY